jgi:hypothetical protein
MTGPSNRDVTAAIRNDRFTSTPSLRGARTLRSCRFGETHQRARVPEPQHELRPVFSPTVRVAAVQHFQRHDLEHELARNAVAAFSLRAVGAIAQAVQRSCSLRPVAFDCYGRLPLSLRSAAQAGRGLQDRRSRRGSLVERHRRENEARAAWPSTSHRGRRGSDRRTSRWSPS